MRLSVFAIDVPVPPNSGARIDINRRLKALTQGGFKIQLFVWIHSTLKPEAFKTDGICEEVVFIDYRQDFSARSSTSRLHKLRVAALKLFSLTPAICRAMALSDDDLKRVVKHLDAFAPDALMIDGLQCAHAGFQALKRWTRPVTVLYRSHNLECKYNYDLARYLKNWMKKAQFYCDAVRLVYYEPYVMLQVSAVLQISHDDFTFWHRLRLGKQFWLPPVAETRDNRGEVMAVYDIVILSGWSESQKAAGLLWFLNRVRPLLPAHLKIAVAGRGASSDLQERCRQSGCVFLGEVPDAHEVLAQGAVLINAVFGGSGFYMKMLDLLRAERPIVSTPDGVIGMDSLPDELVRIAGTPRAFADAILDALGSPMDRRAAVAAYLDKYSEEECVRRMREIIANCHVAPVGGDNLVVDPRADGLHRHQ